jgi:hypothetical protein
MSLVIASQRVRTTWAGPMTGSAKQSTAPQAEKWIASSRALLAMTKERHLQGLTSFASLTSNLPSAPEMTKSL